MFNVASNVANVYVQQVSMKISCVKPPDVAIHQMLCLDVISIHSICQVEVCCLFVQLHKLVLAVAVCGGVLLRSCGGGHGLSRWPSIPACALFC
jgi:hypothetical protein